MLHRLPIILLALVVPAILLLAEAQINTTHAAPAKPACNSVGVCKIKFASGHTLAPKDGSSAIMILWNAENGAITFNQDGYSTPATFYNYGDVELAFLSGHRYFHLSRPVGTTDMTLHYNSSEYDFVDQSLAGMMP